MLANEVLSTSEGDYASSDVDVEADLEVDQLDSSGSDQEQETAAQPASISTASTKKAAPGKPGVRVPGHTLLPQARIENILQADGAFIPHRQIRQSMFLKPKICCS